MIQNTKYSKIFFNGVIHFSLIFIEINSEIFPPKPTEIDSLLTGRATSLDTQHEAINQRAPFYVQAASQLPSYNKGYITNREKQ